MSEHPDHPKKPRSPVVITAAVLTFVLVAFAVGAFAAFARLDGDRIVRGVSVHGLDLSLLTPEEATKSLSASVDLLHLNYSLDDKTLTIDPDEAGVTQYRVDSAVSAAQAVGRAGSPTAAMAARLRAALFGTSVDVPHSFDRVALRNQLEEFYAEALAPATNAGYAVTFALNGEPVVTVTPEKDGHEVNYDAVMNATELRLSSLSSEQIVIPTKRDEPALTTDDVAPLIPTAVAAIKVAPFTLSAKSETWTVSRDTFASWLIAAPDTDGDVTAVLALDHEKVATYLDGRAKSVRIEPVNAVFEEKDGEVLKFLPSKDGETIDVDAAIGALSSAAFMPPAEGSAADRSKIALPMMPVAPTVATEASNPYGIKEVIGIGATNFKGSPVNRRHNIATGAAAVQGTIIKPDEEFSMIKTLGEISAKSGYKQELVIKDNKTTPEYGGGLCQIGSTAFRAALDSGLPITMRQNHSYRVPYYERDGEGNDIGPGKDATIYDPLPDFRFKNDTGNTILITTAIDGNKLSFTFWGTKDGRSSAQTKARVYNVKQPPPKKIIQTSELPIGTEKCTEHAHVGSDAAFTYTVTMPDGDKREKEFVSHYRPWQEVCLVGVDPATLPPGVTSQELVTTPDSAAADAPLAPTVAGASISIPGN